MNKMEFNYLMKQIEAVKAALLEVTGERERRKLFQRLGALKLLRDTEINRGYGIIGF